MTKVAEVSLLLCTLIWCSRIQASPYDQLMTNNYQQYVKELKDEFLSSKYIKKRRSILEALSFLLDEIKKPKSFTSSVIPFNDERCIHHCGSYKGYNFYLKNLKNRQQEFRIDDDLSYTTKKRTRHNSTQVVFGIAIHAISENKKNDTLFLILREIEKTNKQQILLHTLNLFRIDKNNKENTCKLAEFGLTDQEQKYYLMTTFIKTLAPLLLCKDEVLKF